MCMLCTESCLHLSFTVDDHSDDLHDDLLNLFNRADQRAAGLDAVPEHHGGDQHSEKAVRSPWR